MLKAVALGLVLAAAGIAPAVAQQTGPACAAVEDDGERLACYDAVFRNNPAGDTEAIVLQSERLIPAVPSGREPATMTAKCEDGAMIIDFAFAGQQVSLTGDIAPLTLQVDQNATTVRTLKASVDNRSLRLSDERDVDTFLDSLAGGTNLRVRVTPVRMRSLTVDFRVGEASTEIAALRETCR